MSKLIHRIDINHMQNLIRQSISDRDFIFRRSLDIQQKLPDAHLYTYEKLEHSNSFTSSYIITFYAPDTYIDVSEIILYPEFVVIPPIPKEAL